LQYWRLLQLVAAATEMLMGCLKLGRLTHVQCKEFWNCWELAWTGPL